MKVLVQANNALAVLTGSAWDVLGMRDRVKRGYEGEFSDHVRRYDELGYCLQERSAHLQLAGLRLDGMKVLDVGCGTGALAHTALAQGARRVVCGDISTLMLEEARKRGAATGSDSAPCQLDAADLPFRDGAFDAVISGMTFGTLPEQQHALGEMVRVVKPGGLICVGAHGPEHYWEAIDASFRCITKRYILGYRLEWWPRSERYIRRLLEQAKLERVQSRRVVWRNEFQDGRAAYDFFAAISASWWYAKFPPSAVAKDSHATREYFGRKDVKIISDDIVIAYGWKPVTDRQSVPS
jgi:ubiquinone/menaquinone biosynthesis C-methylase UbiE